MSFQTILILSIIQGVTEFLPISSSGHLVIVPFFFDIPYQGRNFDVIVHFGTLSAVLIYIRHDIFKLLVDVSNNNKEAIRFVTNVVIATIPIVVFGFIFHKLNIKILSLIELIGWTTIIFGIALAFSDKVRVKKKTINKKNSLIIGCAQVLSLIPGVSRSGIVITASRFLGYNRILSIKFSLFLSIPAISGAVILKNFDQTELNNFFSTSNIIGYLLSLLFAYLSIKLFIKYVEKLTLTFFAIYRVMLGIVILYFVYLN